MACFVAHSKALDVNLFGFDIGELDLESFVAAMRLVTVAIVAISFLFFYRLERWRILAMGIGALVAVGWFTTFYPLYRVYGLEAPGDRLRNLSWVASVAAGNSPMSTGWVGDLSLEPFWALAAGTLCFGRPEWAPLVYAILSLLIPLLLGFVLFAHFRRDDEEGSGELLGLFVVTFVLLVSTDPLDYVAPFRGFFSRNFFLKPNHSVGYVLIPVLVGIVAGEKRGWVLRATALLCLLGWVFIIHWAFFCLGLGIYLLLRYVKGSSGWGRELGNTLVLWVVSAAAVAPYVYIIYAQYPYALRLDPVVSTQPPTLSYWGDMLPVGSSLLPRRPCTMK